MLLATATLGGFWSWATRELLTQEGMTLREATRELAELRARAVSQGKTTAMQPVFRRVFLRGIRAYLRLGFHPDERDHRQLIEDTLARLATEGVLGAA